MNKINKLDIKNNANALKMEMTDSEIEYCLEEANKFFDSRPKFNFENRDDLKELRYVNENVVNVFSSNEDVIVSADEVLLNAIDREGNYFKVPKVIK
ncbi:MAG: Asp-tRNA(Asn)/Glu-tRNA(Gln) amidotransferase subunit GatC [Bacilli bacterium]